MINTTATRNNSRENAGKALFVTGIIIFVITCLIAIPTIVEANKDYSLFKANVAISESALFRDYSEAQEYKEKMNQTEFSKTMCYIAMSISATIMALCIVGGKIVMSPTAPVNATKSIVEQIKDLAQLKNEGIITEEEFEFKKKELLDKL